MCLWVSVWLYVHVFESVCPSVEFLVFLPLRLFHPFPICQSNPGDSLSIFTWLCMIWRSYPRPFVLPTWRGTRRDSPILPFRHTLIDTATMPPPPLSAQQPHSQPNGLFASPLLLLSPSPPPTFLASARFPSSSPTILCSPSLSLLVSLSSSPYSVHLFILHLQATLTHTYPHSYLYILAFLFSSCLPLPTPLSRYLSTSPPLNLFAYSHPSFFLALLLSTSTRPQQGKPMWFLCLIATLRQSVHDVEEHVTRALDTHYFYVGQH